MEARKEVRTRSGVASPRFICGTALFAGFLTLSLMGCAGMNTDTEEAKTESKPLGVAPIRISWADQNTVKLYGIYGYNVYRSTTPNGEFAKVNTDPIVPSPEDPNPQFVTYYDWGLPMGETFFYYIEAIQEDGSKQKATPVYPLKIIREMTPDEIKEWKADDQKKKEKPKK